MSTFTITDLLIYPVKSMRGISLRNTTLTSKGLENDRCWMVVDADGRFVTQKDNPRLALISTSLAHSGMIMSMTGKGEIHVPFTLEHGDSIETSVWGTRCVAIDQGQKISQWLTLALDCDRPLRLVRMDPTYQRPPKKVEIMGKQTTTDFADIAPYLVASVSSLQRLNSRLASAGHQSVPMDRFRPNIVIRGLQAFAEHELSGMYAAEYELKMRLPCERCIVTTIDQLTANKDPHQQPFKTLKTINPVPDEKAGPAFGHYATLLRGKGKTISVGDILQAVI